MDPLSGWAKYFDTEYQVDYYHNFRQEGTAKEGENGHI